MIETTAWEEERFVQLQHMALDFAREGEVPTLQSMVEAGLNPNTRDHKGNTLLMLSCYHGHYECAKMLLASGADPNAANDHGHSILAGVAFKGYLEIVKLLVDSGAVIQSQPTKNPILFASLFGRKEVVHYLQNRISRKKTPFSKAAILFASFIQRCRRKA